MAGESPDKSDKKQSSGKTARNERDPRLSAFRGKPDESAKESDAGKHPKPEEDGAEAAAEAESRVESASEGASEGAPAEPQGAEEGGAGTEGGDARLRAAVAAWVAGTSDEDGEGGEDAEGAEAGEGGDGEAGAAAASASDVKAEAEAESAAGSGEASGAGAGAAAKPKAKSGAKADGKADAKPGAKPGAKSEVRPSVKAEAKAEKGADEGADEGAEAGATAKAGSGAGAGAKSAASGAEGDGDADSRVDADADTDADAETDAGGEADAGADAGRGGSKAGVKSQPEAKAQPKGKGEPRSEGDPEAKSEAEGKSEGQAKSGSGSKPEAQAQSGSGSKSASPSKAKVVDQPTAVFKTVGPQKGKPGGAAGAASEGNGDGTGGEAAEAEESAVDEATRVFAFAKSKKGAEAEAVDQATTAFKITPPAKDGDAAKSKAKDKPESKGKADAKDKNAEEKNAEVKNEAKAAKVAERDSERTSQFVALKSADDGTAGKSLGKTAPKTPARTPDKAADKPGDKAVGKPADKTADKPEGKVAEKPAGKSGAKPAGKATGALPAAEPAGSAKPAAAPKPADRPGAMPPATTGATAAPSELPEAERTKQQPLPPLDLLAQLTNTPPPPETPLRTVVRRFKIWTPLAVLLAIIFVVVQAVRPLPAPELAVGTSTGFTFEGGKLSIPWPNQGQAAVKVVGVGNMGTSGEAKPVPTASVAKAMTAYVILRDHPLKKGEKGQTITIDAQAEADSQKRDESRVTLKKGQTFTQYQMLQMLMIPSGNNAARQLARWDAGSEKAFAKKMQAAAKDLGMTKTTYTDPSGLDASTKSTAVDQLKLAEEVMKNDAFREVVRTENVQIPGLPERIYNNNTLLTTMAGKVAGIKTGSSTPAGGTFMWAGYRTVGDKDQLLIGVTMDQHVSGPDPNGSSSLPLALNNTSKVITGARDALTSATVVKKGQVVGYVDDGLGGETPVVATKNLSAVGWAGMKAKFSMSDGGKSIPHTAKAGTEVGVLTVGDGESAQKVPVALKQDLVEPGFGAKLIRIG